MPQAKSLLDLMKIRKYNRNFLESLNGNLGTTLGFKKRTGQPLSKEPAIIVFVPRKINPKWIPSEQLRKKLKGPDGLWCALDVVEGAKAQSEDLEPVGPESSELTERLRGWDNEIWAGSQISHCIDQDRNAYNIGTLAAFARKRSNGTLGFLTNQHVAVRMEEKIYHPIPSGKHIGTTEDIQLEFSKDEEWFGPEVDEPYSFVRKDCAFVRLSDSLELSDINPQMMGVGQLGPPKGITLDDMFPIGEKVLHVGRSTGLRRGTIVAFGYEYADEEKKKKFTDLLIAGNEGIPFSTYGDSGSLIVLDNDMFNPIGLLWGGRQEKLRIADENKRYTNSQENWTYCVCLSKVLDALEIDLIYRRRGQRVAWYHDGMTKEQLY